MHVLYNIALFAGIVLGFPIILPSVLLSEKRRKTVLHRLGLAPVPFGKIRRSGASQKPLWVHALSVGEVISAIPLVEKLTAEYANRAVVVSVSTRTGFEVAQERLRGIADAVFFYPYDLAFSVGRAARKVDPALVVIVESDIWPNFLFEMKKRGVPVVLCNARMSRRSFEGYRRAAFFSRPLFAAFDRICAQSEKDAGRFRALGVEPSRIAVTGNIKFEQAPPPSSPEMVAELRENLGIQAPRRVILAGSTHKGEENVVAEAFRRLKAEWADLLLISAPRDPQRSRSVQRIFQAAGFSAVGMRERDGQDPGSEVDVVVVDFIGVLQRLYALADIAFVGGSLVACGGHNPLEPAIFAKPVFFGPDMSDFDDISDLLLTSGGAVRVEDAESLYRRAADLLRNPEKARRMGRKAHEVYTVNQGAVGRTVAVVNTCFGNRHAGT